jgi:hypothetical protein
MPAIIIGLLSEGFAREIPAYYVIQIRRLTHWLQAVVFKLLLCYL